MLKLINITLIPLLILCFLPLQLQCRFAAHGGGVASPTGAACLSLILWRKIKPITGRVC